MVSTSLEDSDSPTCPWMYARVLGVFHAEFKVPEEEEWRSLEFVWVRWFQRYYDIPCGLAARRPQMLSYIPVTSRNAFAFVDPSAVIRACHISPAFAHGLAVPPVEDSVAFDQGGDHNLYYLMR